MTGRLYCPKCQTRLYSTNYFAQGPHHCPTCSTELEPEPSDPQGQDEAQASSTDTPTGS